AATIARIDVTARGERIATDLEQEARTHGYLSVQSAPELRRQCLHDEEDPHAVPFHDRIVRPDRRSKRRKRRLLGFGRHDVFGVYAQRSIGASHPPCRRRWHRRSTLGASALVAAPQRAVRVGNTAAPSKQSRSFTSRYSRTAAALARCGAAQLCS